MDVSHQLTKLDFDIIFPSADSFFLSPPLSLVYTEPKYADDVGATIADKVRSGTHSLVQAIGREPEMNKTTAAVFYVCLLRTYLWDGF